MACTPLVLPCFPLSASRPRCRREPLQALSRRTGTLEEATPPLGGRRASRLPRVPAATRKGNFYEVLVRSREKTGSSELHRAPNRVPRPRSPLARCARRRGSGFDQAESSALGRPGRNQGTSFPPFAPGKRQRRVVIVLGGMMSPIPPYLQPALSPPFIRLCALRILTSSGSPLPFVHPLQVRPTHNGDNEPRTTHSSSRRVPVKEPAFVIP